MADHLSFAEVLQRRRARRIVEVKAFMAAITARFGLAGQCGAEYQAMVAELEALMLNPPPTRLVRQLEAEVHARQLQKLRPRPLVVDIFGRPNDDVNRLRRRR